MHMQEHQNGDSEKHKR